jgi:hypothetical protein
MINGNGVRDDTQQLRDIQDLIAKLADVNRQLALPARALPLAYKTEAVAHLAEIVPAETTSV